MNTKHTVHVSTTITSHYGTDNITVHFDPKESDPLTLHIKDCNDDEAQVQPTPDEAQVQPTPDEARYLAGVLTEYANRADGIA